MKEDTNKTFNVSLKCQHLLSQNQDGLGLLYSFHPGLLPDFPWLILYFIIELEQEHAMLLQMVKLQPCWLLT